MTGWIFFIGDKLTVNNPHSVITDQTNKSIISFSEIPIDLIAFTVCELQYIANALSVNFRKGIAGMIRFL